MLLADKSLKQINRLGIKNILVVAGLSWKIVPTVKKDIPYDQPSSISCSLRPPEHSPAVQPRSQILVPGNTRENQTLCRLFEENLTPRYDRYMRLPVSSLCLEVKPEGGDRFRC